jgi:hypothetical protein
MFLFEFPQNLIGWFLSIGFRERYTYKDVTVIHISGVWGAFALCRWIFADDNYYQNEEVIKHEYGHIMQSRRLLFLFIFIIAIPSLIWAWHYNEKMGCSYYSFYTEAWASKLGGSSLI